MDILFRAVDRHVGYVCQFIGQFHHHDMDATQENVFVVDRCYYF